MLRPFAERIGKTIGVAAKKNQFAQASVAVLRKPFGKMLGIEIFPRGIQEHDRGGTVRVQFLKRGLRITHFQNFGDRMMADAFDVIVEHLTHFGTPGFAQHQQAYTHHRLVYFKTTGHDATSQVDRGRLLR